MRKNTYATGKSVHITDLLILIAVNVSEIKMQYGL